MAITTLGSVRERWRKRYRKTFYHPSGKFERVEEGVGLHSGAPHGLWPLGHMRSNPIWTGRFEISLSSLVGGKPRTRPNFYGYCEY
jgi:hypothetical protein